MKRRIIFIGGIHGVGKSTFCQSLASKIKAKHFSASELIMMAKEEAIKSKRVKDIDKNQDALIYAINKYLNDDMTYLIDGHFCLINDFGEIRRIPAQTYKNMSPIAVLVLHDNPHEILRRLKTRDDKNYALDFIIDFQSQELIYSKEVAMHLHVPYYSFNPFTPQNNICEFIATVLEEEKN